MDSGANDDHTVVPVPPGGAVAAGGEITIRMRNELWLKWAEIAIAHERNALIARQLAEGIKGTDGLAEAFDAEFSAGLVTVTSSAFALEAFGNVLEEDFGISIPSAVTADWKSKRRKVPASVRTLELVKAGFDVATEAPVWEGKMRRLFGLRNDVVHFKPEWHEPVRHATGKSEVSREKTIYSAGEATRSVVLALEIITTCLASPRADQPQVVKWAGDVAHVSGHLNDLRAKEHPTIQG